jgi:AcrR family transcriptional regulator
VPTPARTSVDAIVDAGRRLVEDGGLDALTLQAVAAAVGVRAPSLYKRIDGRPDLVRRVSNAIAIELGERIDGAATTGQSRTDVIAMARAVRAYAQEHPQAYSLLFSPLPDEWRADADLNARISAPILRTAGALAGEAEALPAARTVVAWLQGFLAMELAGAFRLGGDVDAAFDYGVDHVLRGLERAGEGAQSRRRG